LKSGEGWFVNSVKIDKDGELIEKVREDNNKKNDGLL
jgi:hypothetical protein